MTFKNSFLLLCAALCFGPATHLSAGSDLTEVKSKPAPEDLFGPGVPRPRLDRGYLISFAPHSTSAILPNLTVVPPQGDPRKVVVWADQTAAMSIYDAAVAPSGEIVLATQALSQDDQRAWALWVLDKNGSVIRQIRTHPFVTRHLAVSDRGEIWALGVDHAAVEAKSDYNIVRRYDLMGNSLGAYLPRSGFATQMDPAKDIGGGTPFSQVLASPSKVAVFIGQTSEWVEFSSDGKYLSRSKLRLPDAAQTVGMTADGTIVAQTGGYHTYVVKLDSPESIPMSTPYQRLVGTDGLNIVTRDEQTPVQLHWLKVATE